MIEYISDYDSIKIYTCGDYFGTFKTKDELPYKCLKLRVIHIYVVCDNKQGFLAIDLMR